MGKTILRDERSAEASGRLSLLAMILGAGMGSMIPSWASGGGADVLGRPLLLFTIVLAVPHLGLACVAAMFVSWMFAFWIGSVGRPWGWAGLAVVTVTWSWLAYGVSSMVQ